MAIGKELGYTVSELAQLMTIEELMLWSAFFELQNDEQEAMMKKARRR
jgi:hypothetical protein